jgi:hypothetical protein
MGQEMGIDLGVESCATRATRATGQQVVTPRYSHSPLLPSSRSRSRQAEADLRRCQRGGGAAPEGPPSSTAHGADGTSTTRQRARWTRTYDTISHEDLRVATLVQNHHRAKSVSDARLRCGVAMRVGDAGWSAFLTIRTFKAASAGKRMGAGHSAFTSQRCSGRGCSGRGCSGRGGGALVHKGRSVRWQACPECGAHLPRDPNAAFTFLRLGQERSRRG